jgi:hypothetical protein
MAWRIGSTWDVKKYEVWGSDDAGKHCLLAYANVDQPTVGDTILVRGHTRDIHKVWRHHAGGPAALRILVAPALEGALPEA